MVIRIMLMVPLYAIASLISLFSLEAAFFIDAVRDIYEVRLYSYSCYAADDEQVFFVRSLVSGRSGE